MSKGLRLLSYLVRKLSAIVAVLLIMVLAGFIAYDCSNIYVVVDDGMTHRASTVLKGSDDSSELTKFFTLKHLNTDPIFQEQYYRDYNINDYNYKLKVKKLWVWPWQDSARVSVEESIEEDSFRFTATEELMNRLTTEAAMAQEALNEDSDKEETDQEQTEQEPPEIVVQPPKWQSGEKLIELIKVDGQWKIDRVIHVRSLDSDN